MKNNIIKLSNCPFCGAEDVECVHHPYGFHSGEEEYYCKCNNCELEAPAFDTQQEAIDYWNKGICRSREEKQRVAKVRYDYDNFIETCEHCGEEVNYGEDTYCKKCGFELIYDIEEEKKFTKIFDEKVVHPYGWPLTQEELLFSIGKPVYISNLEGNKINWKIINKIEINNSGFNINTADGSWVTFDKVLIYDPMKIIKEKLYPNVDNNEKNISKIEMNGTTYAIKCDGCTNYSTK